MKLSIIIPAYNEAKNLTKLLERFNEVKANIPFELLIVDNNSKDDTKKVVLETPYNFVKYVFEEKAGYGSAIKKGLSVAQGEWVGWTHADMQVDPYTIFQAYFLRENNHYIKGERYGRGILDTFFTVGMSLIETILFQKVMWDINAQPNLFQRKYLPQLDGIPDDFALDLYMYYKVALPKKRFYTKFGPRFHGASTWNNGMLARFKFIKRTLKFSWRLRWK